MRKETTVTQVLVRGEKRHQVRYHDVESGKVKRKFFSNKPAADGFAASLLGVTLSAATKIKVMPAVERERLLFIDGEAKRLGIDLVSLLAAPVAVAAPTKSPAIEDVLTEIIAVKEKAGKADKYLGSLSNIVTMLMRGMERKALDTFTYLDVEKFLNTKNLRSRPTLRSRLSTFFMFGVRRGYCTANPCDRLEPITLKNETPETLTVKETEKCLAWLKTNPRAFGWFVLSCFCGLRPEEAEKTTWAMINFDEGYIRVEAQTTKVGQRRIVYPYRKVEVMKLLKHAKKAGAELPLTTKQATDEKIKLRAILGWKEWKQDVTRHTCASNWISATGEIAAIATALGNSEKILRKNYMALITKKDAECFWNLV